LHAATHCRSGTVAAKRGRKLVCVSRSIALPKPAAGPSGIAAIRGGLAFVDAGAKSKKKDLGRTWAVARGRLFAALSTVPGRFQSATATRSAGRVITATPASDSSACAAAELAGTPGALSGSGSYDAGGVNVSIGLTANGVQLGMQATVGGNTYTLKYDSGEQSCLAYKLPSCPTAEGDLNASGIKASDGFSLTVTRGGQTLSSTAYRSKTTVETKGQVAADAKLDTVEVRYQETSAAEVNGVRVTNYGNRIVTIDMRTDSYGAGDSYAFGAATVGDQAMNTAGAEASATKFAAFIGETISSYHARETAWQTAGKCAKLVFNPVSNSLSPLNPGDAGQVSAKVTAAADGGTASKARWTLGTQQGGSFSPASSSDAQPSFSYTVSTSASGTTISVAVSATSTAGVAQDTWTQKLNVLNTITGNFTGHEVSTSGIVYDWTGTVTFTRSADAPGLFVTSAGQTTVTVSGTTGDGCTYSGTDQVPLALAVGLFTILAEPGHHYQIVAPFSGIGVEATATCPNPGASGPTGLGGMAPTGLQSGDTDLGSNLQGLIQTSSDGIHFDGSASEDDVVVGTADWTWSLTGSP
jgi:hypothetical protein